MSGWQIPEVNYPEESRRLGEQGMCQIVFSLNAAGRVVTSQIVVSTGFARLDAACTRAVGGHQFQPIAANSPVPDDWTEVRIDYRLKGVPAHPILRSMLNVGGAYYPEAARRMREEGGCAVRVYVATDGTPSQPAIAISSRSAVLDQACIAAVMNAKFDPALQYDASGEGTHASADWVYVVMSWRLVPERTDRFEQK
jgi:TonB family protein